MKWGNPSSTSPMGVKMPDRTTLHLVWNNDGLNMLVPASGLARDRTRYDDDGFTNDLEGSLSFQRGATGLDVFGRYRMITERGGDRRADEIQAGIRYQRSIRHGSRTKLQPFASLGLVVTGPLGGAIIQDRFHRLIRWGRTLSGELQGPLQDRYEGGLRLGPRLLVGSQVLRKISPRTQLSAGMSLAVSREVGASSAQTFAGAARRWSLGQGQISGFAQLALRLTRSEEARLSFRGGYPTAETFLEPTLGFSYSRGSSDLGFSLLLNVEGTGAHQGRLSFSRRL